MSVFLPFLVVCSIVVETEEVDIYPEFPEFITREGQLLTPRIILSASS